jgi:hypothetical protein
MPTLVLAGLFIVSSLLLGVVAARGLGLPVRSARAAGTALLEFAGLWVVCLATNLVLGTAVIVLVRTVTPLFVAVYALNDLTVVILSALQAFALHAWMRTRRP